MKKVIFSVLALFFGFHAFGQMPVSLNQEQSGEPIFKKKVDYTLSMGTSYMSSGFGSGSSYYVAPEFRVKLSPKFQVNAGIMLSQNRFAYSAPVSLSGTSVVVKQGPVQESTIYASGIYTVNSKLSFSGSLLKTIPGSNSMPWNNNLQMMSLGMKYKISDNITIGARMQMVQGNIYNPYTGYYTSPLSSFSTWDPSFPLQ
jgi:hypothetical protein